MRLGPSETCPFPSDPVLADAARALADGGHWGWVFDAEWRLVYITDDIRRSLVGGAHLAELPIGGCVYGPEMVAAVKELPFGYDQRAVFAAYGGMMLADLGGDRDRMRALVDPSLHHLIPGLRPRDPVLETLQSQGVGLGGRATELSNTVFRLRDGTGALRGTVQINKPRVGMHTIATMAVQHDAGHLERMQRVLSADRRPASILFADLEGSSALARRLSTSSYFSLTRRLVTAADAAVTQAGGLVGRHVGDGVVAFFPVFAFASESRAARACIQTARDIRDALGAVADRSRLDPAEVSMRFGLHWGSTVYIGGISTGARTEVTALGDEVNEAARIEVCATGGKVLASKQLIERLGTSDADAVGIDIDQVTYTQLCDVPGATDKARRDAPSLAVCEL